MVEVIKLPMWETWIEFQTDMTPVMAEYLKSESLDENALSCELSLHLI